jgi:hypothetical protein
MKTGRNGFRKRRNDRTHLVYALTCEPTGERYIGITVSQGRAYQKSVRVRWQKHVYHAMVEGRDHMLQRAIREHGAEAFSHELLYIVRGKSAAHEIERDLIVAECPELNTECTARKRVGKRV